MKNLQATYFHEEDGTGSLFFNEPWMFFGNLVWFLRNSTLQQITLAKKLLLKGWEDTGPELQLNALIDIFLTTELPMAIWLAAYATNSTDEYSKDNGLRSAIYEVDRLAAAIETAWTHHLGDKVIRSDFAEAVAAYRLLLPPIPPPINKNDGTGD